MPPRVADLPAVQVAAVRQSSVALGLAAVYGPQHAFDGSLDTAVETTEGGDGPWFEVELATAMTIGTTVEAPGAGHLTGLRMYNRHREAGAGHFAKNVRLELYDEAGKLVYTLRKEGRTATHYLFVLAGHEARVKRLRLRKEGTAGALTFSELQLYSDHMHREARKVNVAAVHPSFDASQFPLLAPLTRISLRCPSSRAFSADSSFQFSQCGPLPAKCTSVGMSLSASSARLNSDLVAALHQTGCGMLFIGAAPPTLSAPNEHARLAKHVEVASCQGKQLSDSCVEAFASAYRTERGASDAAGPSVMYVDVSVEELTADNNLLRVALKLAPEELLVALHLSPAVVRNEAAEKLIGELMSRYNLRAFHVNEHAGSSKAEGASIPNELQLTLTRKAGH